MCLFVFVCIFVYLHIEIDIDIIHAYENGCMLFYDGDKDSENYKYCNLSRYKDATHGIGKIDHSMMIVEFTVDMT